jgi:hypothetical protein
MFNKNQYVLLLSDIESYTRRGDPRLAIEWEIVGVHYGDWDWSWCTLQC